MLPIKDNAEINQLPIVNLALLATCILTFFITLILGLENTITTFGFIPQNTTFSNFLTYKQLYTSLFLHGGFWHLLGNMMYLYVFGDNVEIIFGKIRYLLFYLLCGIGATFAQYIVDPSSVISLIGASGAISGVIGAYFLLNQHSSVSILYVSTVGHIGTTDVSSKFMILQWVGVQILLSITNLGPQTSGGVAFMAHVGGFFTGLTLAWIASKIGIIKTKKNRLYEFFT